MTLKLEQVESDLSHDLRVAWRSPSNIAIIKYWGKKAQQIPQNPSLSLTLSNAFTETEIHLKNKKSAKKDPELEFLFEGQTQTEFKQKIKRYLQSMKEELAWINDFDMRIYSHNSFPHSAGIASSASSMSALTLGLAQLEAQVKGHTLSQKDFLQRASYLARLASGSACRSIYGPWVAWGENKSLKESSSHWGSPIRIKVHEIFQGLRDSILIIDSKAKEVSSRAGHQLMQEHPFASARYEQARKNFKKVLKTLETGDWDGFASIAESEALTLHSLMMSSAKPFILMNPNTLQCIEKIWDFRNQNKVPLCFSLDAGPNLHLLYPKLVHNTVKAFIDQELRKFCEMQKVLHDHSGSGPKEIL
ncbi:MAG: diphosphomevalonate decarboxylase [Deltaproteobacteria bacterium]|nr:diphosphomevalonate decarboxylase [Deltaproteobacteria bacterium]